MIKEYYAINNKDLIFVKHYSTYNMTCRITNYLMKIKNNHQGMCKTTKITKYHKFYMLKIVKISTYPNFSKDHMMKTQKINKMKSLNFKI